MRVAPLVALALAGTVAHPARADEPPRFARVHIASEPGQSVVIRDGDRVVRPEEDGSVELAPGDYRLELYDARGRSLGITPVTASGDAVWRVVPPDRTERGVGLGVGIAGTVLLGAGVFMMTPMFMGSICENSSCVSPGERRWGGIGFVSVLVGAIATPVGWSAFARNRRPTVDTAPPPDLEPAPRFSAAISSHGAALSLHVVF